jgi:hypothetical protein
METEMTWAGVEGELIEGVPPPDGVDGVVGELGVTGVDGVPPPVGGVTGGATGIAREHWADVPPLSPRHCQR